MEFFNGDDESCFFENYILEEINSSNTTVTNEEINQTYTNLYSGYEYVINILNDDSSRLYNYFQMNKNKFQALCQEVVSKGIVKTEEVKIEEQVGIFLRIIGCASNMRTIGTNFIRLIDIVYKTFNDVLWSVIEM